MDFKLEYCKPTAGGEDRGEQLALDGLGDGKIKTVESLEPVYTPCNKCSDRSACKLHSEGAKGCTKLA